MGALEVGHNPLRVQWSAQAHMHTNNSYMNTADKQGDSIWIVISTIHQIVQRASDALKWKQDVHRILWMLYFGLKNKAEDRHCASLANFYTC